MHIFDRHGDQVDEIGLSESSSPVLSLKWSPDGEVGSIHIFSMTCPELITYTYRASWYCKKEEAC